MKQQLSKIILSVSAAICGLLGMSGAAQAKQCIHNKGGFVLEVAWWPVQSYSMRAPAGQIGAVEPYYRHGRVVPVDAKLALGQTSCIPSSTPHFAILSIAGCVSAKIDGKSTSCTTPGGFRIPRGTEMARSYIRQNGPYENLIHAAMAPMNCETLDGYCYVNQVYNWHYPKSFLFIQPSNTNHLDVWGTIFDVQWGSGGLIQP